MQALAAYILKGRIQAIGITSFLTFISLMLPPVAYILGGVPVGLVCLRRGSVIGAQVILGSLLVVILLALTIRIDPQFIIIFALEIWVPLWICAMILRKTESQGYLVLAASAIGALYIIAVHLLIGDVTEWWRNNLETGISQAFPADIASQYETVLYQVAPYLNGLLAGSLIVSIVAAVLVARWWQSAMFNPGGFKKEFYELRLPRFLLYGVMIGVVMVFIKKAEPGTVVFDLLVLLIFAYFFQGLATAHRVIAEKKLPRIYLIILYVLLLIPQVGLFVACLGMIDSWFRKTMVSDKKNN